MPATAGRVRMPANNRVHSSAALQTHGIWQSAIGYDPYAPNKNDSNQSSQQQGEAKAPNSSDPDAENAYASFQGLLALAKITNSNADEARGACKKCGRVGHLTFQCRNFLSIKDEEKEKDSTALQAFTVALDRSKFNGANAKAVAESSEESSDDAESETSDSDVDPEIEKIIAARYGKKGSDKVKSSKGMEKASKDHRLDHADRRKRGRSKKRSTKRANSDSDDNKRERNRREKRRRRHAYSDDEEDEHGHHHKSRKEKRKHVSSEDEEDRHRHGRKNRKEKRSHRDLDESSDDGDSDRRRKNGREKKSSRDLDERKGRPRHRKREEKKRSRYHSSDDSSSSDSH